MFSRDTREIAKFNIAVRSLLAQYRGGSADDRTDDYGDVIPEARTIREEIDIAAQLKMMAVVSDMHHAKATEIDARRIAKQAEINSQREMLSQWRLVP